MENRFAKFEAATEQADEDLRKLEFSENVHQQEGLVARLVRHEVEWGFTEEQQATFDVLLADFNRRISALFRNAAQDKEPRWIRPPFPLNDGEVET